MKKGLGKLSELDFDVIYLKANPSPSPTPNQLMIVNEISLITNIIRSNSMTWFFFYASNTLSNRIFKTFFLSGKDLLTQ